MSELLPSRVRVVGVASSDCEGSCAPSAREGRGEDVPNLSIKGVLEGLSLLRRRARMEETVSFFSESLPRGS